VTQKIISISQAQLVAGVLISPPTGRIWQLEEIGIVVTEPTEGKANAVIVYVSRGANIAAANPFTTYLLNSSKTAAGAAEVDAWIWAKGGIVGPPAPPAVEAHYNQAPINLTSADQLQLYLQPSSDGSLTSIWVVLTDVTFSPAN